MNLGLDMQFVQENLWLVVLALAGAIGVVVPSIAKRFSGIPQIGVAETVTLINRRDALVLDVRSPAEFGGGHVPNARHIPATEIGKRMAELDKWKNKPVVVHCATGNRSQNAAKILKAGGFQEVFNLQGGIGAWQQAGMPTEK